jgi:lipopolysaccharide cholinephosphotransferase
MNDVLEQIQKTEYEILKELDRICRKHHIRYFLGHGTLLGAAKYQGFIPWDDDVDVLMSYDAIEKLMTVFKEEAREQYLITNHRVEKHYPLSWTKIRNTNTLSRPKRYRNIPINWGICIDLFPIYPVSNIKILRQIERISFKIVNKLLLAELTKHEKDRTILERFLEKIPLGVRIFSLNFLIKLLTLHKKDSEYVLIPCKGVKIFKRSLIFGKEVILRFEDRDYPVPTDYQTYLTLNYGDYMAPLPKEEQGGHELKMGDIEWKLE